MCIKKRWNEAPVLSSFLGIPAIVSCSIQGGAEGRPQQWKGYSLTCGSSTLTTDSDNTTHWRYNSMPHKGCCRNTPACLAWSTTEQHNLIQREQLSKDSHITGSQEHNLTSNKSYCQNTTELNKRKNTANIAHGDPGSIGGTQDKNLSQEGLHETSHHQYLGEATRQDAPQTLPGTC